MDHEEFRRRIEQFNNKRKAETPPEEVGGRLAYETKKIQTDAQRAREICFQHAKATRETEMLREQMIKAAANGEDFETLFYMAVKIIGLATSDTGILPIIEGAIRRSTEKRALCNDLMDDDHKTTP